MPKKTMSRTIKGRYVLGQLLGKGAFGKVYKALDLETGVSVALKQIDIEKSRNHRSGESASDSGDSDCMDDVIQEINLLSDLRHKNIVQYLGCFRESSYLYIALEFVESGSLASIITTFGSINETLVAKYTLQILHGLEYLHAQGIIHKDIKAANILTTKTGSIKLTDFGVSQRLADVNDSEIAGSPYWLAREVIIMEGCNTKSDIWSLGSTVIELLTGRPPFSDLQPVSAMYHIATEPMPIPQDISADCMDFLGNCFLESTEDRWSASRLLTHPWIRKNNNLAPPEDDTALAVAKSARHPPGHAPLPRALHDPKGALPGADPSVQRAQARAQAADGSPALLHATPREARDVRDARDGRDGRHHTPEGRQPAPLRPDDADADDMVFPGARPAGRPLRPLGPAAGAVAGFGAAAPTKSMVASLSPSTVHASSTIGGTGTDTSASDSFSSSGDNWADAGWADDAESVADAGGIANSKRYTIQSYISQCETAIFEKLDKNYFDGILWILLGGMALDLQDPEQEARLKSNVCINCSFYAYSNFLPSLAECKFLLNSLSSKRGYISIIEVLYRFLNCIRNPLAPEFLDIRARIKTFLDDLYNFSPDDVSVGAPGAAQAAQAEHAAGPLAALKLSAKKGAKGGGFTQAEKRELFTRNAIVFYLVEYIIGMLNLVAVLARSSSDFVTSLTLLGLPQFLGEFLSLKLGDFVRLDVNDTLESYGKAKRSRKAKDAQHIDQYLTGILTGTMQGRAVHPAISLQDDGRPGVQIFYRTGGALRQTAPDTETSYRDAIMAMHLDLQNSTVVTTSTFGSTPGGAPVLSTQHRRGASAVPALPALSLHDTYNVSLSKSKIKILPASVTPSVVVQSIFNTGTNYCCNVLLMSASQTTDYLTLLYKGSVSSIIRVMLSQCFQSNTIAMDASNVFLRNLLLNASATPAENLAATLPGPLPAAPGAERPEPARASFSSTTGPLYSAAREGINQLTRSIGLGLTNPQFNCDLNSIALSLTASVQPGGGRLLAAGYARGPAAASPGIDSLYDPLNGRTPWDIGLTVEDKAAFLSTRILTLVATLINDTDARLVMAGVDIAYHLIFAKSPLQGAKLPRKDCGARKCSSLDQASCATSMEKSFLMEYFTHDLFLFCCKAMLKLVNWRIFGDRFLEANKDKATPQVVPVTVNVNNAVYGMTKGGDRGQDGVHHHPGGLGGLGSVGGLGGLGGGKGSSKHRRDTSSKLPETPLSKGGHPGDIVALGVAHAHAQKKSVIMQPHPQDDGTSETSGHNAPDALASSQQPLISGSPFLSPSPEAPGRVQPQAQTREGRYCITNIVRRQRSDPPEDPPTPSVALAQDSLSITLPPAATPAERANTSCSKGDQTGSFLGGSAAAGGAGGAAGGVPGGVPAMISINYTIFSFGFSLRTDLASDFTLYSTSAIESVIFGQARAGKGGSGGSGGAARHGERGHGSRARVSGPPHSLSVTDGGAADSILTTLGGDRDTLEFDMLLHKIWAFAYPLNRSYDIHRTLFECRLYALEKCAEIYEFISQNEKVSADYLSRSDTVRYVETVVFHFVSSCLPKSMSQIGRRSRDKSFVSRYFDITARLLDSLQRLTMLPQILAALKPTIVPDLLSVLFNICRERTDELQQKCVIILHNLLRLSDARLAATVPLRSVGLFVGLINAKKTYKSLIVPLLFSLTKLQPGFLAAPGASSPAGVVDYSLVCNVPTAGSLVVDKGPAGPGAGPGSDAGAGATSEDYNTTRSHATYIGLLGEILEQLVRDNNYAIIYDLINDYPISALESLHAIFSMRIWRDELAPYKRIESLMTSDRCLMNLSKAIIHELSGTIQFSEGLRRLLFNSDRIVAYLARDVFFISNVTIKLLSLTDTMVKKTYLEILVKIYHHSRDPKRMIRDFNLFYVLSQLAQDRSAPTLCQMAAKLLASFHVFDID